MPTLTTLRIGLPVCPVHSPPRTWFEKSPMRSSTLVHLLDHVLAVHDQRAVLRHPQRHVQHRPVLADVDVLAGEHRVAAPLDVPLLRELDEQLQRLVGDAVLGVVEREPGALGDQALAAVGVLGEELAQVALADLGVVLRRGPSRPWRRAGPASRRGSRPGSLCARGYFRFFFLHFFFLAAAPLASSFFFLHFFFLAAWRRGGAGIASAGRRGDDGHLVGADVRSRPWERAGRPGPARREAGPWPCPGSASRPTPRSGGSHRRMRPRTRARASGWSAVPGLVIESQLRRDRPGSRSWSGRARR